MTRPVQMVFVLCLFCLSLPGFIASLHTAASAQTIQPPGGFLEKSGASYRQRWSNDTVRTFLPTGRGKFTFPAPYNTQGVRITDSSDCGSVDCLWYVGYSYWRNTNNHVGSSEMLIFLTFNKALGGAGPTLFSYNKTTDTVTKVGPLFPDYSPYIWQTGEGWYFSATRSSILYMYDGPRMLRYDVYTKAFETVFDVTTQYGTDRRIWQMHSSNDDAVHSATLRKTSTGEDLGCVVYRETTKQFSFYPKVGTYDECHIDKSGRYLLILELIGSQVGVANRYIDIETGVETRLLDAAGTGTLGHHDMGFGYVVGADRWNAMPNATATNRLSPSFSKGSAVNYNYSWDIVQANHVAHGNAKANTPIDQQYACGSNADRISYAQNEIVCFRLDNSMQQLVVAPVMTDLNAAGGGNDYAKCPKGNLDITGQYFIWTSNVGSGRQEAFIVKVPAQLLLGQATAGGATISASSTSVQPGASVSVTIANGPGNTRDWVGLYAATAPSNDPNLISWKYLNGSQSAPSSGQTTASLTFAMPSTAGTYQFRFFPNDTFNLLAASPNVVASASSGASGATISASSTSVQAGASVSVTVYNGPGNIRDWVGLYAATAPSDDPHLIAWKYLNGTQSPPSSGQTAAALTFAMPSTAGTYQFRFFPNATYNVLVSSPNVVAK